MLRALAVGMVMLGVGAAGYAGSLTAAPSTLGGGTMLDTYYIFPDNQRLSWLENAASPDTPPAAPWGLLEAGSGTTDLEAMASWVCTNRDAFNIKAALGMGDMTRQAVETGEWQAIADMVTVLDGCSVPYLPAYGNHDGVPTVPDPGRFQNATNYFTFVSDPMAAKGWFAGSRAERPDWVQTANGGVTILYTEDTGANPSRSFWVPIPPFNIAVPEWEYGIRVGSSSWQPLAGGDPDPADAWIRGLKDTYPHDYWLQVTHAGPCQTPQNCDLIPWDTDPAQGGQSWAHQLEVLGPQFVAFLNGHWGRESDEGCWGGGGTYTNAVRDDGSRWIAGGFDTNCGTRQDASSTAAPHTTQCPDDGSGACTGPDAETCSSCDGVPTTWTAWMYLERDARRLCMETIRTVDMDTNNDGVPQDPATLISAGSIDRGFGIGNYPYPDPLDPNASQSCTQGLVDSGVVTGCPNEATPYCIDIRPLPGGA